MKPHHVAFLLAGLLLFSGCVSGNTAGRNDFSDSPFAPSKEPTQRQVHTLEPGKRSQAGKAAELNNAMWPDPRRDEVRAAARRKAEREKFEAELADALAREKAR